MAHRYPYHEGLVPPHGGDDADWIAWAQAQPFTKGCGVRVDEVSEDRTVYTLEKSPVQLNPNGALFGGLVPAIADAAAGAAFMRAAEQGVLPATVHLTTQYHRPAFLPLTFEARMTQFGRTIAFCHVDVLRADGRVSNTAEIVFSVIPATD